MKTKSSNSYEDSRKVRPMTNQQKDTGISRLRGRYSGDGRERSYENETGEDEAGEKWKDRGLTESDKKEKEITGKLNQDQDDVKKEFEIRSGKSEKSSDTNRETRPGGPLGKSEEELEEEENEKFKEKGKGSSWHKSYKGDAEVVI